MRTEIYVDDRHIEINEFVQEIIGRTIAGAVSALKGVDERNWKKIEVRVTEE